MIHPVPEGKATVRKRPAQTEDESLQLSEASALPQTPAESESSQTPAASEPSSAYKAGESPKSTQASEQSAQEPSSTRRRISKKGSASVAEQGSIAELRSSDPPAPPAQESVAASSSSAMEMESPAQKTRWEHFPDDEPESSAALVETVAMEALIGNAPPVSLQPAVAAVAVSEPPQPASEDFLQSENSAEWPKPIPGTLLPIWDTRKHFLDKFLTHKVVIAC